MLTFSEVSRFQALQELNTSFLLFSFTYASHQQRACQTKAGPQFSPNKLVAMIPYYHISCRGNSLRSIPFVMSGHLIFNFFQTLGLPIFNTNPNNGCPKRIYQHSGQAHKHFSHRFHGVSFLADVQT